VGGEGFGVGGIEGVEGGEGEVEVVLDVIKDDI
jgi:hypothetical protein